MQILSVVLTIVLSILAYRLARKALKSYQAKLSTPDKIRFKNQRLLAVSFLLLIIIICLIILKMDPEISMINEFSLTISKILTAIVIVLLARIADSIISARLDEEIKDRGKDLDSDPYEHDSRGARVVQYIIVVICGYFLLKNFKFLNYSIPVDVKDGIEIAIKISDIFIALLIILLAQLLVWASTSFFLKGFYKRKSIDIGKQYAYNQLFSYLIYFFAVIFALQNLGINMTLLWTGAAALLVGIGIALQQTISDFFSGIVLLFERSVQVGDFLEVGSEAGTLLRIGLRASAIETRENKTIVIPNSKLVNDNVVNWSNIEELTRFDVSVGVAYGSDTDLVQKLLLEAAKGVSNVSKYPKPFVRFLDFGESSLDFKLFFFSKEFLRIEDVKSNMRLNIDRIFREHEINIPFPQRDLWIKDARKLQ